MYIAGTNLVSGQNVHKGFQIVQQAIQMLYM